MKRTIRTAIGLASLGSCLAVGGCIAAAERGLDLVLSPAAAGNIARVPYTAVSGLAQFLAWLRG
jgi:hypothetical protein